MNAGWIAAFIASARRAIPKVVYAFRVKKSTRIPLFRSTFWSMRIPTKILLLKIFITSFAESALRMTVLPTHSLRSVTNRSRISLFNGRTMNATGLVRAPRTCDKSSQFPKWPVIAIAGWFLPSRDSRMCSSPSILKCSRMYAASIFGRWTNSAAEVPICR